MFYTTATTTTTEIQKKIIFKYMTNQIRNDYNDLTIFVGVIAEVG